MAPMMRLPVKLGLEVDYVGERQSRLLDLLAPYPWDFLLGSVHWIDGEGIEVAVTPAEAVELALSRAGAAASGT